jgi:hypothetical protein
MLLEHRERRGVSGRDSNRSGRVRVDIIPYSAVWYLTPVAVMLRS